MEDATGSVNWIDSNSTHLVTSSEDGVARLYSHSSLEMASILSRSSLPLRCVSIEKTPLSNKSPRVAVVSDELLIKVMDISDIRKVFVLTGHSKPVRTVSWHPKKPILVSTGCDGLVRVWDLFEPESKLLKEIKGVIKENNRPENEFNTEAVWNPDGSYFVLPSNGGDIIKIDSKSWEKNGIFDGKSGDGVEVPIGEISYMSFSANGRYLAASTSDSQLTIWETSSRKVIKSKKSDSLVTGISWNPMKDDLAWTDDSGQLTRWENVVGDGRPSSFEAIASTSNSSAIRDEVDDLFEGTGLDDDEMEAAVADLETGNGHGTTSAIRERATEKRREKRAGTFDDEDLDDFIEDDENGENQHKNPTKFSRSALGGGRASSRAMSKFVHPSSISSLSKSQPAFQSGSTPLTSTSTSSRRFLSFNDLGTLVSVKTEENYVIQFESFDVSKRRNFRMTDHFGYDLGNLGETGALLATSSNASGGLGNVFGGDGSDGGSGSSSSSNIFFKPFETAGWTGGQSDEWNITLPKGETVITLALGGVPITLSSEDDSSSVRSFQGISALVATSSGYLRTFSPSGLQLSIIAFPNPIVTISAGKFKAIIISRRTGGAIDGYQNLSFTVLDLKTQKTKAIGEIPLSKNLTLTWVGFNELDIPSFMDSNGTVFVLEGEGMNQRWKPVLETKNLKGNNAKELHYWPVSVEKDKLQCLILRGSKHPDANQTSQPLIQELEFMLPVCSRGDSTSIDAPENEDGNHTLNKPLTGSALFEEKYLRESLFGSMSSSSNGLNSSAGLMTNQMDSKQSSIASDKALLQIVQLACKSDKHSRALDAASLLNETRMLDAAIQIATFFHLPTLVERMEEFRKEIGKRGEEKEKRHRKKLKLLESGGDVDEVEDDSWMRLGSGSRSAGRVLAPPTQESSGTSAHGVSTNEDKYSKMRRLEASRALGEGFTKNSEKKSLGNGIGGMNGIGKGISSPIMPPPTSNKKSEGSGIDWPESSAITYDSPSSTNEQDSEGEGMDLDGTAESNSDRKRKSNNLEDEDEEVETGKKPNKKSESLLEIRNAVQTPNHLTF